MKHAILPILAILSLGNLLRADNDAYPPEIAAWTPADIDGFKKAGAALKQQLEATIAGKQKEFTIPPGNYFFEGKSPAIRIKNAEGITINGAGATLWFDPSQQGIDVEGCRNVTLRGFTMDYWPMPNSQGRVLAIDPKAKTIDLEIDPGFPVPENAKWVKRVGAIKTVFFDPSGEHMRETQMDWVSHFEPIGERKVRVQFKEGNIFREPIPIQEGDRMAIPFRDQMVAYASDDSSGVTLEDVTIHAAGNFAVYEEPGEGGNIYRRVRIIRRPGTKRLLACNADLFHVNTSGKGPLVEECEFSYACDDMVNIHSLFGIVTKQTEPRKFVFINHYAPPLEAGQKLQIFDFFTFELLGEPTIVSVKKIEGTQADADRVNEEIKAKSQRIRSFKPPITFLEVEIDRDMAIPQYAMAGPENSGGSGTILRNNYFHDNFTRGLLLRGSDILVENNRIERTGWTGLQIGGDRFWLESPTPRRITVRNNTFTQCAFMQNMTHTSLNAFGAISVTSLESEPLEKGQMHARDIVIENNTIDRTSLTAIVVVGAEDCKIADNKIIEPCLRQSHKPAKMPGAVDYAISLTNARGITLKNNTIANPGPFFKGGLFLGQWSSGTLDGKPFSSDKP